jgi:predicted GNAT family acetyltransferase
MVGWVATAESARRSGLAARITAEVTNLGLERGARLVSLQASPMGESVYAALGYRELFRYRVHLAPAPEG